MFKKMILTMLVASALTCPDEPYCQSCIVKNDENICEFCYQSILVDKKCKSVPKKQSIANCSVYGQKPGDGEQELECESCEYGFGIKEKKCDKCEIKGCAVCTDVKLCTACDNGKKPVEIEKVVSCSEEKSDTTNCEITIFKPEVKCDQCKKGFVLFLNKENQIDCKESKVPDCREIDSKDENKCKYCSFGFYIASDGKCKPNETGSLFKWFMLVLVLLAVFAGIGFAVNKKSENDKPFSSEALIN